jgi:hypothetical protein
VLTATVISLLTGAAADGTSEAVCPLVTVDLDGFPRVCLLSRSEIFADENTVACVFRSRRTKVNLQRDGRATLIVVGEMSAFYCRLIALRSLPDETGALAVEFSAESQEEDTLNIPLRPMTFTVTPALRLEERWERDRSLLRDLQSGHGR